MRVYPEGPTTVSPVPGLTIWIVGPTAGVLGRPNGATPVTLRFGMDTPAPSVVAGTYRASFVYIVEPW